MKLAVILLLLSPVLLNPAALAQNEAPAQSAREVYANTLARYLKDRDLSKAREGYELALEKDPLLMEARKKLVVIAALEHKWDEEVERLQDILRIGLDKEEAKNITEQIKTLSYFQKYASLGTFSEVSGEIQPPKLISKTDPQYPRQLRKKRIRGDVLLWLEVDEAGMPTNIRVISGPAPEMNESAADAVKTWKFEPAMRLGKPVRCGAVVAVSFKI